jgi:hypothetical protein
MKLKITQVPYKHDYELSPRVNKLDAAQEDYEKIKKLVQENKLKEAEDLVNQRMLNEELAQTARKPKSAGMVTKEYFSQLSGDHILKENPEILKNLQGGHYDKVTNQIVDILHPNYKKHMENAYKKGPLLNKIKKKFFSGRSASDIYPMSDSLEDGTLGDFSRTFGIRVSPYQRGIGASQYQNHASYVDSLKHELDHALDFAAETLSEDEDFLKEYPKYKAFKKEDFPDKPESGYVNPIIPNLEDYDFKEGEFKSNYVRDPVDIAKEVTGNHRYGRKHLFEELMKKFK